MSWHQTRDENFQSLPDGEYFASTQESQKFVHLKPYRAEPGYDWACFTVGSIGPVLGVKSLKFGILDEHSSVEVLTWDGQHWKKTYSQPEFKHPECPFVFFTESDTYAGDSGLPIIQKGKVVATHTGSSISNKRNVHCIPVPAVGALYSTIPEYALIFESPMGGKKKAAAAKIALNAQAYAEKRMKGEDVDDQGYRRAKKSNLPDLSTDFASPDDFKEIISGIGRNWNDLELDGFHDAIEYQSGVGNEEEPGTAPQIICPQKQSSPLTQPSPLQKDMCFQPISPPTNISLQESLKGMMELEQLQPQEQIAKDMILESTLKPVVSLEQQPLPTKIGVGEFQLGSKDLGVSVLMDMHEKPIDQPKLNQVSQSSSQIKSTMNLDMPSKKKRKPSTRSILLREVEQLSEGDLSIMSAELLKRVENLIQVQKSQQSSNTN
jgi:hypothetical protein